MSHLVGDSQFAVISLELAVRVHQAHKQRRKIGEGAHFFAKVLQSSLEPVQGPLHPTQSCGNPGQNTIPVLDAQRIAHAARCNPRRMDALPSQEFDDLLAKLAQSDPVMGERRIALGHAKQVALGRVGFHAQQEIGRGKIKEAQGMRLDNLRQVHHVAELGGGIGNPHR
jgi:hypothetical protein